MDVYDILEGGGDIIHFLFRRRRTMSDVGRDREDPRIKRYIRDLSREQFSKLIYHLKKNNWIEVKSLKGHKTVILTKQGVDKALKAKFKSDDQKKTKRKDKKWLMIIFDVPEKSKVKRELLRSILKNLGYKLFQKSVWITPYDVSEKTEKALQFYTLDNYVRTFVIEEIR